VLNKIIVVGGGSAGWMSAATLVSQFPNKEIILIESPNVPTVGVGESTLGQINDWLNLLNIKDEDFMPFTDASYKLSIRFENFYKNNDGGFHYPFGKVYENNQIGNKELWFLKNYLEKTQTKDYATWVNPNMALVNNNVLFKNENKELDLFDFKYDVAYHFDATKFGLWLKDHYCKPKGVKHILEDIKSVETNDEGVLSLNKKYKADLFLDCTGFESLLLNKTLKVKFNNYNKLLPNNKAWATRINYTDKKQQLKPYTNCTALGNGWVWNIPLWSRIGTGYVYSDKYITDQEALTEFKQYLKSINLNFNDSTFKNIKMNVGIHEKIFFKNVCAIGLSAGFIEPLESNGLLSVHQFLINLVKIIKRDDQSNISEWDKDNFNYTCIHFFNSFTEFVALHYALSHRKDTKYWKDIFNKSFLDNRIFDKEMLINLQARMNENEYYSSDSGFHYISTGMHYFSFNKLKFNYNFNDLEKISFRNRQVAEWNSICKSKPLLYEFLRDNIHKNEEV
jgi:hypothetical protein